MAEKEFKDIVKEKLTKETLDAAWVLKRKNGQRLEFELRCNKCEQFPTGYYNKCHVNNAREAKVILYTELMEKLEVTVNN